MVGNVSWGLVTVINFNSINSLNYLHRSWDSWDSWDRAYVNKLASTKLQGSVLSDLLILPSVDRKEQILLICPLSFPRASLNSVTVIGAFSSSLITSAWTGALSSYSALAPVRSSYLPLSKFRIFSLGKINCIITEQLSVEQENQLKPSYRRH